METTNAVQFGIGFVPTGGRFLGVQVAFGDIEYGKPWLVTEWAAANEMLTKLRLATPSIQFKIIRGSQAWQLTKQATEVISGRRQIVERNGAKLMELADESKATYEQCLALVGDQQRKFLERRELYRQAAARASAIHQENERIKNRQPRAVRFKKREVTSES